MAPQTDLISAMMAKNLAQLALTAKSNPEPNVPELEVKQDRSQSAKPSAEYKGEPNSPPPPNQASSSPVNSYLTEERLNAIREELKRNTPGPATASTTTTTTSSGPSRPCPLSTPELAKGKGKAKKKKSKKVHWREEMMKPYNQYKADKRAAWDNLMERKWVELEESLPDTWK